MGIEMRKYGRERGQGDQTMLPGELDGDAMPFAPKQLSKQEFGRRVYQLMIAKGWRQSDLARHSGVPKDSISTYIRGKVLTTPVSVSKLAEALGVSPEKLMPDHIEGPANVENPELEIRANPGMNGTAWLRVKHAGKHEDSRADHGPSGERECCSRRKKWRSGFDARRRR